MVVCDSVIRLLEGAIRETSHEDDSFSDCLLYTSDEYKMTYEYAKEELATEVNMHEAKETVRLLRCLLYTSRCV